MATKRTPKGGYGAQPAQQIRARLTSRHNAELKLQLALELKRG